MNKKRFVGFALALAGILLALSRIALTGAVIGATNSSLLGAFAAVITIAGVLLVLADKIDLKNNNLHASIKNS